MKKTRTYAVIVLLFALGLGYANYRSEFNSVNDSPLEKAFPALATTKATTTTATFIEGYPLKFGLDLRGGSHLVYKADTSKIDSADITDLMNALRDVIERRINVFGVSEPVIQVESKGGIAGTREDRLVVELPGVTDIKEAVALIGQTPTLEFKVERPDGETQKIAEAQQKGERLTEDPFLGTPLTGRYIKRATIQFDQNSFSPSVSLEFNEEGGKIFAELTKNNINKLIAIYLDGVPIQTPVVREEIRDGKASISGNFSSEAAKTLVGRLNSGALPVSIELVSTQSIGASLGEDALKKDVSAAVYGFLVIVLFLIFWYRFPGLIASASLVVYVLISLALFKLIPVVLSSAGIAGFILSIGMAVDANILIFERTKEELKKGLSIDAALREGFHRAWPSIRDSNVSSMITAVVLFWLGTSLVKGFALTFGLGVVVSMFTAITVTRTFLFSFRVKDSKASKFLFSNGFHR